MLGDVGKILNILQILGQAKFDPRTGAIAIEDPVSSGKCDDPAFT